MLERCFRDGMLFGRWDVDDVFAYRAPRTVFVRDSRLCFTKIAVLIGITIYVFIYSVLIQRGYLKKDKPEGAVQFTLRDSTISKPTPKYCTAVPICNGSNYCTGLPCIQWDYHDSVYPEQEETSMFITTRARITQQVVENDCFLQARLCDPAPPSWGPRYYVPRIEDATFMLRHNVYSAQTQIDVGSVEMSGGFLVDKKGDEIVDFNHPTEWWTTDPTSRPGDIAPLSVWLKAADKYLDEPALISSSELLRYSGGVFLLHIEYSSGQVSLDDLSYTYRVHYLPRSELKYEQVVWATYNATHKQRVIVARHGIRFMVLQSGYVGRFDMQELLKTLVTATALAALSDIFVRMVVMRLLPLHMVYKNYMRLTTVDCSDVKQDGQGDYIVHTREGRPAFRMEAEDFAFGTLRRGGNANTFPAQTDCATVARPSGGELELPLIGNTTGAADSAPLYPGATTSQPGAASYGFRY
eukprot:TRINITY_DN7082_c0_g1_i1.p1 TRINITY_DN7082_c0_g1~~TRINITY_DN7082_c0_g1_i1.p1  ORF type:complete len:468 (+),score=55.08 TRINITY_DN7082_c0_g1_i1:871-2274(+)